MEDDLVLEVDNDHEFAYSSTLLDSFSSLAMIKAGGLIMAAIIFFAGLCYNSRDVFIPDDFKRMVLASIEDQLPSFDKSEVSHYYASGIEKLELWLRDGYSEDASLSFLENFPDLEELELHVESGGEELLKTIPMLSSLEKLSLDVQDYEAFFSKDNLGFLEKLLNLKHLVLQTENRYIFPFQYVEKYCSQLEVIELSLTNFEGHFSADFSKFPNLKELCLDYCDINSNYADEYGLFAGSFSRNDYQELIDRGVEVNISGFEMEKIEEKWQEYETLYDRLGLDNYNTPMEKVDAIALCYLEGELYTTDILALTHMCGIRSLYSKLISYENNRPSGKVISLDVFGNNNYYCFQCFYSCSDEERQELIYNIKNGSAIGSNGYMVPLDSVTDYTLYNVGNVTDYINGSGKIK